MTSRLPENNSIHNGETPAADFLARANAALMKLRVAKNAGESREAILLANDALLVSPATCANPSDEKMVRNLTREMIELRRILLKEYTDAARLSVEKAVESKSEYTSNIAKDLVRTLANDSFRAGLDEDAIAELDKVYSELSPRILQQSKTVALLALCMQKAKGVIEAFSSALSNVCSRVRGSLTRPMKPAPREEVNIKNVVETPDSSASDLPAMARKPFNRIRELISRCRGRATIGYTAVISFLVRIYARAKESFLHAVESVSHFRKRAAISAGKFSSFLPEVYSRIKEHAACARETASQRRQKAAGAFAAFFALCSNVLERAKKMFARTRELLSSRSRSVAAAIAGFSSSFAHTCLRVKESSIRFRESALSRWKSARTQPGSIPFLSKTHARSIELFACAQKSVLLRKIICCGAAAVLVLALARYSAIMFKNMRIEKFETCVKTGQYEDAAKLEG